MSVRTTQRPAARSSVTTLSEGTTAPVVMVTTWRKTNALAPVQMHAQSNQEVKTGEMEKAETDVWGRERETETKQPRCVIYGW